MFRPAARFLIAPRPPDLFAARFLAAVILPPLLFFAILNLLFDLFFPYRNALVLRVVASLDAKFLAPSARSTRGLHHNSLCSSFQPTFSQAFPNNCSFLYRALKPRPGRGGRPFSLGLQSLRTCSCRRLLTHLPLAHPSLIIVAPSRSRSLLMQSF